MEENEIVMTPLEQRQHRMLTEPVNKLIMRLALPSIAIMLISALYNLADTYFVSSLGTSATAAVGVVFTLMYIIQAIGFFFGHGSGNNMSRAMGAGDYAAAEVMASTGIFLSVLFGAVITVFGLIFIKPLLYMLGSSDTMYRYAHDYVLFILIAAPFMTGSLSLNNQLRYLGSSNSGMWGMIAGALINLGLDPLFIYVFHWETGGAGAATAISQIVGFIILYLMTFRKGNIRLRLRNIKINTKNLRDIAGGGIPSLLQQLLNSAGGLVFNHTAGIFGDVAVAAISVVQRVTTLVVSAIIGFGQGYQPVCGYNYGAKKYDRVLKAFWFCARLIFIILIVLSVAAFLFAPEIISLFGEKAEELTPAIIAETEAIIAIGKRALRLQCFTLPFMGVVILSNMMLQTIGASYKASLVAVSRSGMFLIPSILVLQTIAGLRGLEAAQMTADILTTALAAPIAIITLRKMRRDAAVPAAGD